MSSATHSNSSSSPSITVFLTVLLLVFFFFGFFTIYFCKSFIETLITSIRNTPNSAQLAAGVPVNPPKEGLEHTLIQSFPTFVYASVKDYRKEKYGLECAICLVEFEDDSMLRLLTTCCHVFHQECIDLWLESHKTCPFCRGNLELTSQTIIDKSPILAHDNSTYEIDGHDSVYDLRIDIDENKEGEEEGPEENKHGCDQATLATSNVTCDDVELVDGKIIDGENEGERFSRSHSTGHSIVRARSEEEDRYTLRLPENVSIRLLRGHNATGSCMTFGEFSRQGGGSSTKGGGFGEVVESGSRIRGEIN